MAKKVEIYTAGYCPFCSRAKRFLKQKGIDFIEYDVVDEPKRREEMKARVPGAKTVPQILIDDKSIGGCDDMLALDEAGEFDRLFA